MLQRLEPQGQKEKQYGTQLQDRASATRRKTKHRDRDWTWTENDSKGFKGGLHTTRYKVTGLIFQKAAWFTGELKRECENSCLVQPEYQRRMTVAINLKLMLGLVVCLASCVTDRLEPCPERRASKQIALSRPATSTKPSAKNANKTAAIEKASYTRKSALSQYAGTSSSQPKAKKEAIQYNAISFPMMRLCRKAHEDDLTDSKGLIMIRGSVNLNHPDLSLHVSCSRGAQTLWVNKPHKFLWSHWFTAKSFFLLSTRKISCHLLWQRLIWFVASVVMLVIFFGRILLQWWIHSGITGEGSLKSSLNGTQQAGLMALAPSPHLCLFLIGVFWENMSYKHAWHWLNINNIIMIFIFLKGWKYIENILSMNHWSKQPSIFCGSGDGVHLQDLPVDIRHCVSRRHYSISQAVEKQRPPESHVICQVVDIMTWMDAYLSMFFRNMMNQKHSSFYPAAWMQKQILTLSDGLRFIDLQFRLASHWNSPHCHGPCYSNFIHRRFDLFLSHPALMQQHWSHWPLR